MSHGKILSYIAYNVLKLYSFELMFSVLIAQFSEHFRQGEVFQPKPRLD